MPCMVTYLHPFRLVSDTGFADWQVTLEQVNRASWDHIPPHEIIGGIDVGLPEPYHMVISRDGAVGLPPLEKLRTNQAGVEFFNRAFAALLLGGGYCEAISLDNLEAGFIVDWRFLRVNTFGPASPNRFHRMVRSRQASPIEAIALLNPQTIQLAEINKAMKTGRAILEAIPELSGEFLLKGTTGIARTDWSSALANLWIIVEQVTSHLWKSRIIQPAKEGAPIPGRADQLSDTRTWTIAARHELLHRLGIIPESLLAKLAEARKARNELSHMGTHPTSASAHAAFASATGLLEIVAVDFPLLRLNLNEHLLSDPFAPRDSSDIQVTHWMKILKLPGEEEIEELFRKERASDEGA